MQLRTYLISFFAMIGALALVGAGCNNATETNTNTITTNINTSVKVEDVADDDEVSEEPESTVKEFSVTARQFEFDPATITVNEGDTVKLNITSEDVVHGFSIAAFGVSQTLSPGQTKAIEFIADKAGSYPYVCSVACGSGHTSMKGTLIVE